MANSYNSDSIQILEGLEAVRKRPGMYIGSTNKKGLHHLVWEIIDNSVDEALAGHCDSIFIKINNDNSITIKDNGRGIPVDIHSKTGVSTVETVFTVLHAGGKFNSDSYKISGGLHGVGASVVNALSKFVNIVINKDGKKYLIEFVDGGKVKSSLKEIGTTDVSGTEVTFLPDKEIFTEESEFDFEVIEKKAKQLAFLNKGLSFIIIDEKNDRTINYKYEEGIKDYIKSFSKDLTESITGIFYTEDILDGITVECGFQYNNSYNDNVFSFCNNINTSDGGTHEEGMKLALVKEINRHYKASSKSKNVEKFIWDDIKEGIVAILSIKHPDPQYEGQTKGRLGSSDAKKAVNDIVSHKLQEFLLENPQQAKKIIEKIQLSFKARVASQNARESTRRKTVFDSFTLPGKLTDCETKDKELSEIYIVEGDSAGGSAKSARHRFFQAILPLRGKVLNVERVKQEKVTGNNEINSIILALGTGIKNLFDEKKLRYNKVIIMTDADVDGAHIKILLLTFFYRYMKKLLENGHVYIAQPPLFKLSHNNSHKYLYSEKDLEKEKAILDSNSKNYNIQRYKGLGEMNPDQLWDTTMNPEKRLLLKVNVDDALAANELFVSLMGDNPEPRKKFIKENAKFVKNLDV